MKPLVNDSRLEKKRWVVFVLACFILICAGANYAWSVFAQPLAQHLNGEIGDIAFAFSLASCCSPVAMLVAGWVSDHYGPKPMMILGGLMMGGAFIGCSFATNAITVIIVYGVVFGLGMGVTFSSTTGNLLKFFPDRSGFVSGLAMAAYGASSVIIPPIAVFLLNGWGVQHAFFILGAAFIVIVVTGGALSTRCPVGFVPTGFVPKKSVDGHILSLNTLEMARTKRFWFMWGMGFCGALAGMMAISYAAMIAQFQMQYEPAACAMIVSVVAIGNMSGRFIAGVLSDYIGRVPTLLLAQLFSFLGMLILWDCGPGDNGLFVMAIIALGLAFGAYMGVYPSLTTEEFGPEHNSANYGMMVLGFSLTAIICPYIMNLFYSRYGEFDQAYLVGIAVTLLGFVFGYFLKRALDTKS